MKLPISERLLACAELVPQNARAADIGTDHGYLAIHLIKEGIAKTVIACDLRQAPLQSAKQNAERFGVDGKISFRLADGLAAVSSDEVDTVICAGMGGDLIRMILEKADWLKDSRYTLILQPQSAAPILRAWLCEEGFEIREEKLLREGGFFYTVMKLRFGSAQTLTPGQQYLPPPLIKSGSPLLREYAERMETLVRTSVDGLLSAEMQRPEKLRYFQQALAEIREMRKML